MVKCFDLDVNLNTIRLWNYIVLFILCLCVSGAQSAQITHPISEEAHEPYQIWHNDFEVTSSKHMKDIGESLENLSPLWRVQESPTFGEKPYEIVGFPGQNRKTGERRRYADYRPAFPTDYHIDSLVLTRSNRADFLDHFWTPNGFSSHGIITAENDVFIHANPLRNEKAQMAGTWNSHSIEIAFIDEGDHRCSSKQQESLKNLLAIFEEKLPSCKVRYGGSIWDAKQSEGIEGYESGKLENVQEVLEFLSLLPFSEYPKTK